MPLPTISLSNTISDLYNYANTTANAVNVLNATAINGAGLAVAIGTVPSGVVTITVPLAANTDVSTGSDNTKALTSLAITGSDLKTNSLRFTQAFPSSNTNFNTLTLSGFYQCSGTLTNGPDAGPGFIEVFGNAAGTNVSQYYTNQTTNAQYSRVFSGGAWTAWSLTAKGALNYVPSNTNLNTNGLLTGGGLLANTLTLTVPIAANTDIVTGTDNTKAVTSLALAFPLSLKVPTTRNVSVSGLITGGGTLAGDITISLAAAANTDVSTGTSTTKAVTPQSLVGGGVLFNTSPVVFNTVNVLASGLATGGGALTANVTISVPKAANTDVFTGTDDTKAVTSLGITNAGLAFLTKTNQSVTGGARYTAAALTAGNVTIDSGSGPYQAITNNAAFTITAPANDGGVDLLVTNGATAGAITFTGFTVGTSTGDALTTVSGNKFMIYIRRVNSTSTYSIQALQ